MAVELEHRPEPRAAGAEGRGGVGTHDAVTGEVEPVRVGLEPVAQRDVRHGQAVAGVGNQAIERVVLLVVEAADVLGHDRADQHAAERGAVGREVAVVDRHPPRRHVPTGVADVQLGEQHPGSSDCVDDRVERGSSGAWPR